MADRVTCAATSRSCGEEVLGTASRARRWLLMEQPGPWGVDAISESDLAPEVAAHLHRLAVRVPCRVLLLRRTGGNGTPGAGRVLYAGVSRPGGGGWLERIDLGHPEELLDLDLSALRRDRSIGGTPVREPIYLVCTNGRHDPCCAEYGLPVARALADDLGDRVWECSHVGGDRFAANLVCLPDGVFYGHLDPDTARQAVAAHEDGRMLLDKLRGRSAASFVEQAAEVLVRRAVPSDRLLGLRLADHDHEDGVHRLTFALDDGRTAVARVAVHRDGGTPRALTCATGPSHPPVFDLEDLEVG